MKIVITGANGYIGSVVKEKLYWNLTHEDTIYPIDLDRWDITQKAPSSIKNIRPDVIVHLAAKISVSESVQKPWEYYNININGTKNIIDTWPDAKMIFASTGAAFDPKSPYGLSKVAAEDIIKQNCYQYTIFRFFNVSGRNNPNEEGLAAAVRKAIETKEFTIHGQDYNTKDGTPVRDFVHVDDVADAIINAIRSPAALTDYEPLGSGKSYTIKEYLDTFKEVNGDLFEVKYGPRRPGDLPVSEVPFVSKFITNKHTLRDIVKS